MMMLDCLVSNPLRKQMFHQDYIDLGRRMKHILLWYSSMKARFTRPVSPCADTKKRERTLVGQAFDSRKVHRELLVALHFLYKSDTTSKWCLTAALHSEAFTKLCYPSTSTTDSHFTPDTNSPQVRHPVCAWTHSSCQTQLRLQEAHSKGRRILSPAVFFPAPCLTAA